MTFEARDNAAKVVPATSGNNNEDERKASLKVTIFTVILSRAGGMSENLGGRKQAEFPIIWRNNWPFEGNHIWNMENEDENLLWFEC